MQIKTKLSQNNLVIAVMALSGAAALIYEVSITQAIIYFYNSSTYSFATVLAAFLCGLAIGSYLISRRIDQIKNKIKLLAFLQLAAAAYAAIVLASYDFIFPLISNGIISHLNGFFLVIAVKFFISFLYLVIPTIMLGASFPLASSILTENNGKTGQMVGQLYFWDLIGATFGAILCGFVLIPLWGVSLAISFGAVLNIIGGLVIFEKKSKKALAFLALAIIIILSVNATVYGKRKTNVKNIYGQFYSAPKEKIFMGKDTPFGKVQVISSGGQTMLYIDNDLQCGSEYKSEQQNIPPILKKIPSGSKALDIGLGCGYASKMIDDSENVSQLDIVEINPEMAGVLKYFDTDSVLTSPKAKIINESVTDYLGQKNKKFDFINSDLNMPYLSNISAFYTVDYFKILKKSLNDGGTARIWACCGNYDYARNFYWTLKQVFPRVMVKADSIEGDDISALEFIMADGQMTSQTDAEQKLQGKIENDPKYEISTLDNQSIGRSWYTWALKNNKNFNLK